MSILQRPQNIEKINFVKLLKDLTSTNDISPYGI